MTNKPFLAPLLFVTAIAPAFAASDYTVYELLAPSAHSFDIIYDVSIDREGAAYFFNPIRPGSISSNERVVDLSTGKPLEFREVDAKTARDSGLVRGKIADDQRYIRVKFARPVPKNGEVRIRIYKTYTDPPSYYETTGPVGSARGGPAPATTQPTPTPSSASGTSTSPAGSSTGGGAVTGTIAINGQPVGGPIVIGVVTPGAAGASAQNCVVFDVSAGQVSGPCPKPAAQASGFVFDRPLGIKRNVVVLPAGYELVGSQSPGIVSTDPDGRVRISFLNDRDDQLPVKIIGRKLP